MFLVHPSLNKTDLDSLIGNFSGQANSLLLYTIWRLLVSASKSSSEVGNKITGSGHFSFSFLKKPHDNRIGIPRYLHIYEELLLIGAIIEVEFNFYEYNETTDNVDKFLNIKIHKDNLRKQDYDTMKLWKAGMDNADKICYISVDFTLNIEITKKLIKGFIDKWINNQSLDPKIDIWTSSRQLEIVGKKLIELYEYFGNRKFEISRWKVGNPINIDFFPTLLYLTVDNIITLSVHGREFPSADEVPSDFFVSINDIEKLIKIAGSKSSLTQKTKSKVQKYPSHTYNRDIFILSFDKDSGIVLISGKEIGRLGLNTRAFFFFDILFSNYGKPVTYDSICKYLSEDKGGFSSIDSKLSNPATQPNYLASIKKEMPDPIKKYVKSAGKNSKSYILKV